ncbi:hypothetical protein LWC34_54840 [Kibdelosporangium philippinense]|uniref:Uncharacterized protein n=1 Tax=Kibdelosporangium philippinense TaxID=211113 RepID=A0ABS8ZVT6_9PSEU|nr:hypothetical protein [Kibdelosporangium philippinense]MCE7011835.1 hypothetical protein [Kibdelosporangium philippinense]
MRIATEQPGAVDQSPRLGIPDPAGMPPLCDEVEFVKIVGEVVANDAPRRFAVVAEYGDRVDAMCVAWGLAFERFAFAVSLNGHKQYLATEPESVLPYFRVEGRVTPRLIWHDNAAATAPESED